MNNILPIVSFNLIAIILCFSAVWLWQLKTKNAGVVDALWGFIFLLQATIYFFAAGNYTFKNQLIFAAIVLWGLRLCIYLALRNIGKPEDKRYADIRLQAGTNANKKILSFYLIQAALAFLLFLPIYLIFLNPSTKIGIFEGVGIAIFIISALCEAISDEQLRAFKANKSNIGEICDKGFWYYSRHPNYFFEWLAWVGLFIIGMGAAYGFIAIYMPAIMYFLLTKGTGIQMTEAVILTTKEHKYKLYINTTSAFFPWKKK
jgi:steroid 5-alpha reductase family enzyme